jgi:hypothetical protein
VTAFITLLHFSVTEGKLQDFKTANINIKIYIFSLFLAVPHTERFQRVSHSSRTAVHFTGFPSTALLWHKKQLTSTGTSPPQLSCSDRQTLCINFKKHVHLLISPAAKVSSLSSAASKS